MRGMWIALLAVGVAAAPSRSDPIRNILTANIVNPHPVERRDDVPKELLMASHWVQFSKDSLPDAQTSGKQANVHETLQPKVSESEKSKPATKRADESTIQVLSLSYGANCNGYVPGEEHEREALQELHSAFDGKHKALYKIYNINFGDGSEPLPGCYKDFKVDYSCSKTPTVRKQVMVRGANGKVLEIDCPAKDTPASAEPTAHEQARVESVSAQDEAPNQPKEATPEAEAKTDTKSQSSESAASGTEDVLATSAQKEATPKTDDVSKEQLKKKLQQVKALEDELQHKLSELDVPQPVVMDTKSDATAEAKMNSPSVNTAETSSLGADVEEAKPLRESGLVKADEPTTIEPAAEPAERAKVAEAQPSKESQLSSDTPANEEEVIRDLSEKYKELKEKLDHMSKVSQGGRK